MTSLTSSMFLLSGLQTRRIMTGADKENKVRPHQTCILETLVVRADSSTGQKCCTSGFHSLHSTHSTRSSHGQLRQLRQLSPQLSPQLSQLGKVRLLALRSTQIQVPYPSGSRSARLRTISGLENPKMIFCHGVICLSLTKVNSQQPSEFADKIFIMPGSGRFTSSKLS